MLDCVEIARRLGRRVGDELKIPVYLYEEAAAIPERKNLAKVRKGEYEQLKKDIKSNNSRKPDFGPSKLGPAGATTIGARPPLIAYNVYLNTADVSIAKKIAKTVRHSSGGLHFVKGAGFLVDGRAQVSMNLTNYRKTPVFRVVELIRREAAHYGIQIEKSELIGLIPQEALFDSAAWYLQLDDFEQEQILEVRMQSQRSDGTVDAKIETTFLDNLAAGTATPGGGSAAANAGAMAAGLVGMVARLTVGKKKYKDVEAEMWGVIEKADKLRAELSAAVEQDSAAFEAVMAAFRLPKSSDDEKALRLEAIEQATLHATEVPLDVAAKSVEVLELALQVVADGNTNAITDAGTAAALARASLNGVGLNVRINLISLNDKSKVRRITKELKSFEKQAAKTEKKIRAALSERGGLSL